MGVIVELGEYTIYREKKQNTLNIGILVGIFIHTKIGNTLSDVHSVPSTKRFLVILKRYRYSGEY